MNISITSRHGKVPKNIKEYVGGKLLGMVEEYTRIESAHVIFDKERFMQVAEIVVQGKNHLRVEARDSSDDLHKSIDMVLDKLDRQLRKSRDKLVDHKSGKHRLKLRDLELKDSAEEEEE